MPPNTNPNLLNEIHRLVSENNRMLHAQRRSAFMWGLIKFIVYVFLFAAPIWFYMTYLSNTVDNLVTTVNKVQGTQTQAVNQFSAIENAVKNFQSKLPAFLQGATTTSTTTQ